MLGWELAVGLYPGILFGMRSYEDKANPHIKEHVFYIPFVELILTLYYEQD